MRIKLFSLLFWLLFSGCSLFFGNQHPGEMIRIEAGAEDARYQDAVRQLVNRYAPVMAQYFDARLPANVRIGVVRQAELRSYGLPDWAGAAYIPSLNKIVVKKEARGLQLPVLERQFVHELSHLFFHQKFSRSAEVPLWYNEGLAESWRRCRPDFWESARLSYWLLSDNLLSLREIGGLHRMPKARAQQAYLQSCLAAQYLHSYFDATFPRAKFYRLVEQVGWPRALFALTGLTPEEFENTWREDLAEKYTWTIFLQTDSALWIFMVVIVIISFFLKKIYNRRRLKQWEKQEEPLDTHSSDAVDENQS